MMSHAIQSQANVCNGHKHCKIMLKWFQLPIWSSSKDHEENKSDPRESWLRSVQRYFQIKVGKN